MIDLAQGNVRRYGSPVAAESAAGFGRPNRYRRNSAFITVAGAFFVRAIPCYGGCAQDASGCAGSLYLRSTNLRTAATHSFGRERGSFQPDTGATSMRTTLTLNPSKSHAAAWKARAFAALRADSSLAVRLRRYNLAMERARALETAGGAQ